MGIFEDQTLSWNDTDYVIKSDRMMRTIAEIEDVITITELFRYTQKGDVPLAKVARGYGVALRCAGATVTDEEVFVGMFRDPEDNTPKAVSESVWGLLEIMLPPEKLRDLTEDKDTPTGNAPTAAVRSSKKRTKRRSSRGE